MNSRRKVMRDVVARTADGKLFHARGAATENARSPKSHRKYLRCAILSPRPPSGFRHRDVASNYRARRLRGSRSTVTVVEARYRYTQWQCVRSVIFLLTVQLHYYGRRTISGKLLAIGFAATMRLLSNYFDLLL